jgi:hypothetical protein
MHQKKSLWFLWMILLGIFLLIPQLSIAKEQAQQWEIINPSGVIETKYFKPAPRLTSLDGKTIVLRWNEKHNGNLFLDRIAELLHEKVPTAKVIKLYEVDKSTIKISGSAQEAIRIAEVIKGLKADIVIAAQAD